MRKSAWQKTQEVLIEEEPVETEDGILHSRAYKGICENMV